MAGVHTWIISGGSGISLTVKITGGTAEIVCNSVNFGLLTNPRFQIIRVSDATASLMIKNKGIINCLYKLSNACTGSGNIPPAPQS